MNAAPVRELRVEDVDLLAGVLSRAYASPQDFKERLDSYLRMQRVRTFVVEHNDEPAGVVVGNDYTTTGYVSLMGVDPRLQRRGFAMRLMEALIAWSDSRGFTCLELDATDAGAPLYLRFGFQDAGQTHVFTAASEGGRPDVARAFSSADRAALLAFDREAFGADRRDMLELLIDRPDNRIFVAGAHGHVDGYAVAQPNPHLIGPVVAASTLLAGDLIDAARCALSMPYKLNVPSENADAVDALLTRGFVFSRSLRHMVRGSRPSAARERLYARANLGQG